MKTLLIINPNAGKKQIQQKLYEIIKIFSQNGHLVTVYPTQKKLDATDIVVNIKEEFDYIVCCGGDGTLNEVISGMMMLSKRPLLGYIPCGTTNDVSSSLGLKNNCIEATNDILEGKPFSYDVGEFNGRFFSYIASFGMFTNISYTTPQPTKNAIGKFAYYFEGIKHLTDIKEHNVTLEYEGQIIEDKFIFGSISNTRSIAGFLELKEEDVELNDGVFEVMLVKAPRNAEETIKIVKGIIDQNYKEGNVLFFHTSEINIYSEDNIRWCLDGEDGGFHKNCHIINYQKSINFIINN